MTKSRFCLRWLVGDLVRYLTKTSIDTAALIAQVASPERGGTVVFLGTVRRGPDDGRVAAIDYTAYEDMVVGECDRLVGEVADRWPDAVVALEHRVGRVPLGEASVAIVAAAGHRHTAFEVCRFAIEELKRRVPIWKHELMDDGSLQWREPA